MASFDKAYSMVQQDELDRFMKDFQDHLRAHSAKGLEGDVDKILDMIHESHDKYVPEDTQATKNSWYQEVKVEEGQITAIFGNDKEGQLDYVPFIYLGYDMGGNPINFKKAGAIPMWLEQAFHDNIDAIERTLSKKRGK